MEKSEELGALFLTLCYLALLLWILFTEQDLIQTLYIAGCLIFILACFLYGWYRENEEVVIDPGSF